MGMGTTMVARERSTSAVTVGKWCLLMDLIKHPLAAFRVRRIVVPRPADVVARMTMINRRAHRKELRTEMTKPPHPLPARVTK